jgi:hypothetical protein
VRVFKDGRTTGRTTGYLHNIGVSVTVGHSMVGFDGACVLRDWNTL